MQYIRTCINGGQTRRFGVSDVHTQWMTHGWCIRMFPCGIRQQPANIDHSRQNKQVFRLSDRHDKKRKTLEAPLWHGRLRRSKIVVTRSNDA